MTCLSMFKSWIAHPLTRGLDIDDPRTTQLRRQIIREKPFLRQIYEDWYASIASVLPSGEGPILEIGSGAGFSKDVIPDLITSEVFYCRGVDVVLDGCKMPFGDGTLKGIFMTDVFHHLAAPRSFLIEATRCVRPGGVLAMIEPWVTPWSSIIYRRLHHEPFRPEAPDWASPTSGPLSGANSALPWIVFQRDRGKFASEFQGWGIETIQPMMPFRYLVSGGVSMRSLMPAWTSRFWRSLERRFQPWIDTWGMFAMIVLHRVKPSGGVTIQE